MPSSSKHPPSETSYPGKDEIERGQPRDCTCRCGMLLETGTGFVPGTGNIVPVGGQAIVFVKYKLGSNTGADCQLASVRVETSIAPEGIVDVPGVDPSGHYVFVRGLAAGRATVSVISRDARTRCITESSLTKDVDCGESFIVIDVV